MRASVSPGYGDDSDMAHIDLTLTEENIDWIRSGGVVTIPLDEGIIDADPRIVIAHEQHEAVLPD